MNWFAEKLLAYAELGRVSNLPTIVSNVLVGAAAGVAGMVVVTPAPVEWLRVFAAWIAITCFYVAGMAMNDLFDAALDSVDRPSRPIPSGRIRRHEATAFMMAMIVLGLAILAVLNTSAFISGLILIALIVSYNYFHLTFAGSVVLMGLARGMVYVVAATAVMWPTDWMLVEILAGTLALYTILFSLIARSENKSQLDRRKWLAVFIPFVAATPAVFIQPVNWAWMIVPLAIMLAWLSRGVGMVFATPPRTKQAVMTWLAGICLLDVFYLTLLNRSVLAAVALGCFGIMLLAQRRIMGT